MNADKLLKLEKNNQLKRKFYLKGIWRNYAFIPPTLILFASIFGILYLLNSDMLISLYAIPFIVIFIVGTIWLKATRKYLVDQKIASENTFLICTAIPLTKIKNQTIIIFSTGNSRHNKNYLERKKQEILTNDTSYINKLNINKLKKEVQQLESTDIYLSVLSPISSIIKKGEKTNNKTYHIIYTTPYRISYILEQELKKYNK
jgi:hypothetical protein